MSKVNKGSKLFKGIGQRLRADGSMENDSLSRAVAKKKESMKPQDFTKDFDRIRKMKNSEAFVRKMEKVEQELNAGRLKRDTERIGKNITKSEVNQLYSKLEERKRQRRLKRIVETIPENFYLVDSLDKMDEMVSVMNKSIEGKKVSGFDIETFNPKGSALDMTEGKVAGFSWSWRGHNYYVPLNHVEETGLPDHLEVMSSLKPTLERLYTVMHNAKFDCKWLLWHYDIDMANNLVADTNVMAFMLDDEAPSHSLKTLTIEWLGKEADYFDQLFPNVNRFDEVPLDIATYYAAGDTEKTLELYHYIEKVWRDERYGLGDVRKLFYEVELPVIKQFVYSDVYGINLDTERALELYDELEENIKNIKRRIEEMYGQEINLNSPSQISKMLYDDFELPDITKGWNREKSTDKKALNALKDHHPVVPLIIKHRSESKLQSSYTKSLADKAVNGKVHPDHNTLGARTGRFTCSNPNTQQIPSSRIEFRKIFTASDDTILMAIDYSQIELRVLAHDANEEVLIEAFNEGRDIHSTTASLISDMSYEQINSEKDIEGSEAMKARDKAKTVNFGIVYGMGATSLADNIGSTVEEAEEIIADYFKGYPGIETYMDMKRREAEYKGYVTDMFGRVRSFRRAMKSRSRGVRGQALRSAGNFPIQSGAGVILKLAIRELKPVLEKHGVHILLQVHDELVFECPKDISYEAVNEIKSVMENVVELKVPLIADVDIYPERWAEKVDLEEWFDLK